MGGMGGSTSTTNSFQASATNPWIGQMGPLLNAFGYAQNLYDQQSQTPAYSGDWYAQATPEEKSAFQNQLAQTQGVGNQAVNTAWNAGTNLLNNGQATSQSGINSLQSYLSQNPQQTAQNNIDIANQYVGANNPYLNDTVNAAMSNARQQLAEGTLPTIDRQAVGTGNQNSTRAGVAQGIAQRGVDTDAANLTAQLRNQMFQTGLQQAQQGTANQFNAANSLGSLGGAMTNSGISGLNTGTNMNTANNNSAALSTGMLMNMDQAGLNNDIQKYQYPMQRQWDLLNNYMNIIGSRSWGSNSVGYGNSTTQTQQSPLSMAGGLLSAFGGLL